MKYYLIKDSGTTEYPTNKITLYNDIGGWNVKPEEIIELTKQDLKDIVNGDTDSNMVLTTYPGQIVKKDWVYKIEKLADIKHGTWRWVEE